ncbi:MAG: CBS domain-containing protein [Alphaproteobacteria bacterium]|nr:CBS domain-containing protein [Alphaproteobacteria bacterium]MCZ6839581.1 CBS domain-containing protein [Alphaproteobacteria bacterium]
MNVDAILRTKGAGVKTARPDWTVLQAVEKLTEHGVGALVVSADGQRIVGIISERDVMRQIASGGPSSLERSVEEVMVRNVITCTRDDTVNHLMTLMTEGRFRHVPVVDDGLLVGLVSIGDVVKRRIEETEHEAEALRQYISTG